MTSPLVQRLDRQLGQSHDCALAVLASIDEQRHPTLRVDDRQALRRKRLTEPADLPLGVVEHVVEPVELVARAVEQMLDRPRERRDRFEARDSGKR